MKKTKGFTLAELLVVVAILAILVAVSIPIFSGKIKETEETVCLTNQASLQHALAIEMMSNDSYKGLKDYYNKNKDQYKCPSKDGKITYSVINNEIKVSCTKHGEVTPAQLLELAIKELFNSTNYKIANGSRVDSNAPNNSSTPKAQLLRQYLESSSFNDLNVKTWLIARDSKGNDTFIWSECALDTTDNYTSIPAICYNPKDGTYSVGLTAVGERKSGNVSYKVIAENAESSGSPFSETTVTCTNLAEAKAEYSKLEPLKS